MRPVLEVRNLDRGTCLGHRIARADRFGSRLVGLLGRSGLGTGEGLLLAPSRGVHMFGMRFALDVLLLDEGGRVVALFPDLRPGASTGFLKGARFALEVPVGTIEASGTQMADRLSWEVAVARVDHPPQHPQAR